MSPQMHASEKKAVFSKTIGYFATFTALGMSIAVIGPTLPGLAEQTQSQLNQISILFTAHSLGYLTGSFLGGRFFDRLPSHPIMGGMLVVLAIMLALVPITPLLWLLALAVFIAGASGGGLDVGGNLMLVWAHRRNVGPYMNGLHFFFGVGAFLTPIIMAQAVLITGSYQWGYWVVALLILLPAAWLMRLRSPVIQTQIQENTSGNEKSKLIALMVLFFFLYVGAEASFAGWIYTYSRSLNLASETNAAYLTSVFWGALMLGRLLAIPLAVRFRSSVLLWVDLVGCMLSMLLILAIPFSPIVLMFGTVGVGLSMASMFPTMMTLAEKRLGLSGKITGWFLVGSSLGGMTIPWFIGQLFEGVGPRITMVVIQVVIVLAAGVFGLIRANSHTGGENAQ